MRPSGASSHPGARPSTARAASAELASPLLEIPVEVLFHVHPLLAIHACLLCALLLECQILAQQLVEQLRYVQQFLLEWGSGIYFEVLIPAFLELNFVGVQTHNTPKS